jgi:acyl-CoA reductase-like NAD-dependent aldehyde dehydrogenase
MLDLPEKSLANHTHLTRMGRIRLSSTSHWVSGLANSWSMTPYEKLRTAHIDLGVCAGICAWNGSHVLAAWKMAPAMAAGNTFVLKSSEKSPLALAGYGDLIKEVRRHDSCFLSGRGEPRNQYNDQQHSSICSLTAYRPASHLASSISYRVLRPLVLSLPHICKSPRLHLPGVLLEAKL